MGFTNLSTGEILETIRMVQMENLDIRTITMGIDLHDCIDNDLKKLKGKICDKIRRYARDLVKVSREIDREYGVPIVNTRISVTPIADIAGHLGVDGLIDIAHALDQVAKDLGVDFLGGFSALVQKGATHGELALIRSIPSALSETERVCSSVNVGSTRAGINMDAVREMGNIIKEAAERTSHRDGIACAKLVVFCNAPEDNPFMAGAFHGAGEPECVINVGVSGPGVILTAIKNHQDADLGSLAEIIKRTAFKVTRMGELVGRIAAQRLGVPFGIVDLSLAPTPAVGDSVAEIIETMGIEKCGAPGSTAALALMNDAVKKGGAMASSYVGGLSGAFIPLSEDSGMMAAAAAGALSLAKLEAMTSVCSVGLDMIAIPGDTPPETISALIADEAAIGMINNKTTAVRVIPVPGKAAGEWAEFGGLLGRAPIIEVSRFSSTVFSRRGGRIPAPLGALTN
ncbi:MAG TPA: PFL family protein [Firmicutes bacterium]|nr:PFL family protein [Bacillota bacterium]